MAILFTSDLHLSHGNILKYCSSTRGKFSNTVDMNNEIIDKYNDVVTNEDTVLFLGDLSFASPEIFWFEQLPRFNGNKMLLWGNHDYRLSKHYHTHYAEDNFQLLLCHTNTTVVDHDKKFDSSTILLNSLVKSRLACEISHYPSFHKHKNNVEFLIHGHTHTENPMDWCKRSRYTKYDVGIDGHQLFPVNIEKVTEAFENNEIFY